MAKSPSPSPDDDPKKIADADLLFRESPKASPKPKPAPTAPGRAEVGDDHSYDLVEGHDEPTDAGVSPPIPVAPAAPRKPKAKAEAEETVPAGPPATVDEVWTRQAEWGGNLVLVAVAALAVAVLVYLALASLHFLLAFLLLALGGVVVLALCYPMFITLERPVRITPEQAARDFYAMLSHWVPHYKRMWLLLSSAGRVSREFSSYEEFRAYWKRTLAALQGGRAAGLNPLRFQVEDFHSDKSAGQTALKAKFTLKVYRDDATPSKEVASYLIATGLVKGPDRMWYLNSGTLPDAQK